MIMQQSSATWSEVEELILAVDRLSCELNICAYQELEKANSSMDDVFEMYHRNNMEKYNLGVNLCQRYVYGILDLEEFCIAMLEADLKSFLVKVEHYLPANIISEFRLNETSDYGTDESDIEEISHEE